MNPKIIESIINNLKGRYCKVFLGIEEKTIKDALKDSTTMIFHQIPCETILQGCGCLGNPDKLRAEHLIVNIVGRCLSFKLSDLSPLLKLVAQINEQANTLWGITIDEGQKTNYVINMLLINPNIHL